MWLVKTTDKNVSANTKPIKGGDVKWFSNNKFKTSH